MGKGSVGFAGAKLRPSRAQVSTVKVGSLRGRERGRVARALCRLFWKEEEKWATKGDEGKGGSQA